MNQIKPLDYNFIHNSDQITFIPNQSCGWKFKKNFLKNAQEKEWLKKSPPFLEKLLTIEEIVREWER